MNKRRFGNTTPDVGEIGMGCRAVGGNAHGNSYGPTDDETSLAAIKKSLDAGCAFFDTADHFGHGHSEEILGRALQGVRDRVFIATTVGIDFYSARGTRNFTPLYIGFALNKSLGRLQTDYIDLYILQNPTLRMLQRGDLLEHMGAHREIGQIRRYGVSVSSPETALAALEAGPPDALQLTYNIFESEGWDNVFTTAREKGCAIIAREPLAGGYLAGKFGGDEDFPEGDIRASMPPEQKQARAATAAKLKEVLEIPEKRTAAQAAIRFALIPEAVTVAIPGAKTPEQAGENLLASDCPALTEDDLEAISKILAEQSQRQK